MWTWEELMELRKASVETVCAWLVAHGEEEGDWDLDIDEDGYGSLDLHGFYSDSHLVVEFVHGAVSCWYRSEDWD